LQNRQHVKPLIPPDHPELKIEFANYGQAEWASIMPGTVHEPGTTTVRFKAKDILEAYRAMVVMTELAMKTTFC
jgi:D-amino peptidase